MTAKDGVLVTARSLSRETRAGWFHAARTTFTRSTGELEST